MLAALIVLGVVAFTVGVLVWMVRTAPPAQWTTAPQRGGRGPFEEAVAEAVRRGQRGW